MAEKLAPVLTNSKGAEVSSIKQDCEEIWQQTVQLQDQIETKRDAVDKDEPTHCIYAAQERSLKAEIQSMKDCQPNFLPQNKEALQSLVKEMLVENVKQLEQVLTYIKMERVDLEDEIEMEKKLIARQEEINASLENKLKTLSSQPVDRNMDSVLQQLSQKHKKVTKHRKELQKEMTAFVQKHFPTPSEKDCEKFRKRERQKSGPRETGNYGPPQALLENLMNQCFETPHDPYMTIDNTHYPPFIELLLRTGIALRHPEDDKKIKLMPYHL